MNGIPPLSSRDAHASPPQRVLERLHSSAAGLDADEAARRLAAHGYNRLPAPKRQGPLLRLLRQFHNVLLYMMLFASLVTALLGFWVDSAVILLAVVVNALIGFVQEGKAANALDAIRDMLSLHALVLRDGQRQALDAERLVPGDVVLLASGDRVPADLRLFETKNFHVDESALTGESVPVEKGCVAVAIDALLGDRRCMAYSGTLVTSGQARGVVVATAGDTELGRIGTLLREVRTLATPLLRQIASFSRWLALAILLLAGATFVLGTLWQGQPMVDMFMLVVALTASAIPEGLPAIMTVILALGVQRMARRNAIVSRLPAVETLGSVTVICSDKTGTLTRNEMTVQRIVTADQVIEVSGAGYAPLGGFSHNGEGLDPAGRDDLQEIGRAALLCNEARLHQEGEAWQLEGDPTEGALLSLGLKLGLDPQALAAERPRSDAIPFESEHRFMATLHHDHAGQAMVYLARVDPTVSHCTQSVLPIFWEPSIYQTRKQHEFFEEASAAGLVYGLTMPLHGARGELGALSLSVEAENRAEANRFMESVLPTLWMLKDYALQSGAGLAFEHPVSKPVVLTSREKEVLQWCAIGKTSWEISVICNCSEANVNFHMGNIRRKFGVTSRRVAAIMAVNLGLITL